MIEISGSLIWSKTLMELNDRCEDYGKTKTMVVGRKPKKIHMRIKNESVEQVDSLKYLGCNNSSNLNCCQEVKQRIAMAKEIFNRREYFGMKINISRRKPWLS